MCSTWLCPPCAVLGQWCVDCLRLCQRRPTLATPRHCYRSRSDVSSPSLVPGTWFSRSLGGWLLALVGMVIGLAGIVRVLFYRDPISD